jgi:hypothetical protein
MAFTLRVRSALTAAAAILTGVLAGCAEPPPPPAPKAPPPVAISSRLIDQASGYKAYMNRATAISPAFADGTAVATSLSAGGSYDPQALLRGAIAYGAVVALQDRAFVSAVRVHAADAAQRQQIAYAIMRDPSYVMSFNGASTAAGSVVAALGADGRALFEQGGKVKQAAYDIQAFPWSKSEVANRPMRLEQVKAATPLMGDTAETEKLRLALTGGGQPAMTPLAQPAAPPYASLVVRSLAVAAVAALGYGDGPNDMFTPLMADAVGGTCLNLARLNLYQCLAVSKPHYEDVFCLGEHAMRDTGRCLMKSAGAAMPFEAKPPPMDLSKAKPYKPTPKPKPKAKKKS